MASGDSGILDDAVRTTSPSRFADSRKSTPDRQRLDDLRLEQCRISLLAKLRQLKDTHVLYHSLMPRHRDSLFEILEFYGDSVLYQRISKMLMQTRRFLSPHLLTQIRIAVVKNENLCDCFRLLSLERLMDCEVKTEKARADVVESIIGELAEASMQQGPHTANVSNILDELLSFICYTGEQSHFSTLTVTEPVAEAEAGEADEHFALDDTFSYVKGGSATTPGRHRTPRRRNDSTRRGPSAARSRSVTEDPPMSVTAPPLATTAAGTAVTSAAFVGAPARRAVVASPSDRLALPASPEFTPSPAPQPRAPMQSTPLSVTPQQQQSQPRRYETDSARHAVSKAATFEEVEQLPPYIVTSDLVADMATEQVRMEDLTSDEAPPSADVPIAVVDAVPVEHEDALVITGEPIATKPMGGKQRKVKQPKGTGKSVSPVRRDRLSKSQLKAQQRQAAAAAKAAAADTAADTAADSGISPVIRSDDASPSAVSETALPVTVLAAPSASHLAHNVVVSPRVAQPSTVPLSGSLTSLPRSFQAVSSVPDHGSAGATVVTVRAVTSPPRVVTGPATAESPSKGGSAKTVGPIRYIGRSPQAPPLRSSPDSHPAASTAETVSAASPVAAATQEPSQQIPTAASAAVVDRPAVITAESSERSVTDIATSPLHVVELPTKKHRAVVADDGSPNADAVMSPELAQRVYKQRQVRAQLQCEGADAAATKNKRTQQQMDNAATLSATAPTAALVSPLEFAISPEPAQRVLHSHKHAVGTATAPAASVASIVPTVKPQPATSAPSVAPPVITSDTRRSRHSPGKSRRRPPDTSLTPPPVREEEAHHSFFSSSDTEARAQHQHDDSTVSNVLHLAPQRVYLKQGGGVQVRETVRLVSLPEPQAVVPLVKPSTAFAITAGSQHQQPQQQQSYVSRTKSEVEEELGSDSDNSLMAALPAAVRDADPLIRAELPTSQVVFLKHGGGLGIRQPILVPITELPTAAAADPVVEKSAAAVSTASIAVSPINRPEGVQLSPDSSVQLAPRSAKDDVVYSANDVAPPRKSVLTDEGLIPLPRALRKRL